MKFSNILKKIDLKSRKSMLKTEAILFWTDMKRLFNWNTDNFKSNFLSRGQLGSESNDKFFLSVLKMWQCRKYFFGNLIFALTTRMLSGNRLNLWWFPTWLLIVLFHCKLPSFQRACPPKLIETFYWYQVINNQRRKMLFYFIRVTSSA